MYRIIITVASVIFLFISCNRDNPTETKSNATDIYPAQVKSEIYPFSIGNFWEYKEYEYERDTLNVIRDVKIELIGLININFKGNILDVFKVKLTRVFPEYNNLVSVLYYLLRSEPDGIYWYGHSWDVDNNYNYVRKIYLKYPIDKGDSWIDDHSDYLEKFECISTNDTVKINDIYYVCLRIRQGWSEDEDPFFFDSYYSKGVGLIQSINKEPVYYWTKVTKQILVKANVK